MISAVCTARLSGLVASASIFGEMRARPFAALRTSLHPSRVSGRWVSSSPVLAKAAGSSAFPWRIRISRILCPAARRPVGGGNGVKPALPRGHHFAGAARAALGLHDVNHLVDDHGDQD